MYRSADITAEKKKNQIKAEDVYQALRELGFEKYEDELREFMEHYNADKED